MTLQERLSRIEADNSELRAQLGGFRFRYIWLGIVAAAAAGLLTAAMAPLGPPVFADSVTAKQFALIDKDGNDACKLYCDDSGPMMEFYNAAHKVQLRVYSHRDGGSAIQIYDDNDHVVATLARALPEGSPTLHLVRGKHSVLATVTNQGGDIEKQ